jgi:hydroxymethylbilane synthase
VPMGAYARRRGDAIDVICEVLSLDGRQQIRVHESIPVAGCEEHARRIADQLAQAGGRALAEAARKELLR